MTHISASYRRHAFDRTADTATPDAIFTVENVRHVYGQRTILNIAQLRITPGETLALVGPSGAGKSTLLRLLALLEKPTHGRVSLQLPGNGPVTHATLNVQDRRLVTMVFQQPIVLRRSVRKNIAYGLHLRGKSNWQAKVDDLLTQLQLTHVADAPAQSLSGGEKQRVAMARALVLDPAVLILDEPTANLDPYNIRIIESLIRERCQNTTIVMVTHNIFQAKRLADRVSFLLDGQIVETAATDCFFNHPQDPRTVAFLNGDMIC